MLREAASRGTAEKRAEELYAGIDPRGGAGGLARGGALTQRDMGDASLSISNLGMHGVDRFFPIVNVPEPLILGIGQARRVVAVVDDLVGVRTVMSCTASIDHRVIDGELVGRFLQAFKRRIEDPALLAG